MTYIAVNFSSMGRVIISIDRCHHPPTPATNMEVAVAEIAASAAEIFDKIELDNIFFPTSTLAWKAVTVSGTADRSLRSLSKADLAPS